MSVDIGDEDCKCFYPTILAHAECDTWSTFKQNKTALNFEVSVS